MVPFLTSNNNIMLICDLFLIVNGVYYNIICIGDSNIVVLKVLKMFYLYTSIRRAISFVLFCGKTITGTRG